MCHPNVFLPSPADMTEALRTLLPQFGAVHWTQSTLSTNRDLLDMARTTHLVQPCLQGTHWQAQGRGRSGRVWQNQSEDCLMFSCAFDVALPAAQLPMLSPLAGMAACCALRACLALSHQAGLTLKWPNDLQWQGAKLAGILVETTRAHLRDRALDRHLVVMGIGLNLRNASALSLALDRRVADWSHITQIDEQAATIPAAQLVARIAQYWLAGISYLQTHGTEDFAQQYAQVDALVDTPVHIWDQGKIVVSGKASGVNSQGQLLIETGKQCLAVMVGEVSVRAS